MHSIRSLIIVGAACLTIVSLAGDASFDKDLTKKLERIILEARAIKPGMTRADLEKVFTSEGGISLPTWQRYVHRACPYIKVDVEFEPSRKDKATDVITKISEHPFLEFSIND